jgi:hypothetical protein
VPSRSKRRAWVGRSMGNGCCLGEGTSPVNVLQVQFLDTL